MSSFVEETEEDIVQRLRASGNRRHADPHFAGNIRSIYAGENAPTPLFAYATPPKLLSSMGTSPSKSPKRNRSDGSGSLSGEDNFGADASEGSGSTPRAEGNIFKLIWLYPHEYSETPTVIQTDPRATNFSLGWIGDAWFYNAVAAIATAGETHLESLLETPDEDILDVGIATCRFFFRWRMETHHYRYPTPLCLRLGNSGSSILPS
eukprot:gb/GECG01008759.1/.p1 GENE.gb/GECG01008759.1/~~gb/GECG01008759.1/.p1  ORF type:complete len:207 (+),score=25.21 gb/GECG01008759.1/:1-621(+)